MKTHLVVATMLATTSAFAANFGTTPAAPAPAASNPVVGAAAPLTMAALASGPQLGATFRIVKPDGSTIIKQGNLSAPGAAMEVINVSESDAFISKTPQGKCAFNVQYDEASSSAATNTTNRLYSNDSVIAINSLISLTPGVKKTIWTQPYLYAGMNTIRVVVNADGAAPSTKWVRVNVAGTCGGSAPVVTTPAAPVVKPPVANTTPVATVPVTPPAPPVIVKFQPGSAEWNNLNIVWGYSNYATTQLKGRGYARYDELSRLNAAVTAIVNAKSVDQAAYNSLMTTWNTFVTEPAFKSAMALVVAGSAGQK